ncbi:unnamed protein product [Meloidogyne enterolobii]|uniref:Uncharacterized protein n=1 Tax=Meloidogyne enterolobii TaxID=390850 RepID=A0ACB1A5L4_MELEN
MELQEKEGQLLETINTKSEHTSNLLLPIYRYFASIFLLTTHFPQFIIFICSLLPI